MKSSEAVSATSIPRPPPPKKKNLTQETGGQHCLEFNLA